MSQADTDPGVYVLNRRNSRIFDIEVCRYVQDGRVVDDLELTRHIRIYSNPDGWAQGLERLAILSLRSDQTLSLYPKNLPDVPAEYVAVRYTDDTGRRGKSILTAAQHAEPSKSCATSCEATGRDR